MAKLNTQESVVDYLKSIGEDSSYSARRKIAANMGISNYTGSETQNIQMLNTLKTDSNKKAKYTSNNNTAKDDSATDTTAKRNTLNGVDDETTKKMLEEFSPSSEVSERDAKSEAALGNLESLTGKNDIIRNSTWNDINSSFVVPSAVKEADAYLSNQLEKIQSGRTSYTSQVEEMMDKIMNREKFSYDVDSDTLFQQALASAMKSGKQAMQDTIGQASALTGGYGSTYATAAGNQAYNAFIEDAYDNLPQYYQMAMEAYQMEGDELYRQFGVVSEMDDKEYARMVTAYDATSNYRNQMYNEAYTRHRDSVSDAFAKANLEISEHGQLVTDAYNYYIASSDYADKQYEREYNSWKDSVNQATQYAQLLNSDYWAKTEFDEGVRQYEQDYARRVYEYDTTLEEQKRQFDVSEANDMSIAQSQLALGYAELAQADEHFYASLNAKGSSGGGGGGGGGGSKVKTPTETQMSKALEAYETSGDAGFDKYIDSLPDTVDKNAIVDYVATYGQLPLEQRTYTKTKDTWNGGWGIDNNDIVKDQYGNQFRVDELPKSIQKPLTKLDEGKSYTKK